MNSAVTSILTFLEGSKQFVIPIYQRTVRVEERA